MNEEYVNKEITRKLIDKGCPVTEVFISDDRPILYELPKSDPNWFKCKAWYIPTIFQVLKWLREEKKIHISIDYKCRFGKWYWCAYSLNKQEKVEVFSECIYENYEQTVIAGIEYVIDNLI